MSLMEQSAFRSTVIRYVLDRRCLKGGFCFYRLEEPNGSDTWYALSILDLLREKFKDEDTVAYVKGMQHPDGSYDSIYNAWYAIQSLVLLGEQPSRDPRHYVMGNLEHYRFDATKLPAEVISIFRRISYLVDLYAVLEMNRDGQLRDNLIEFIMGFQNEDGGFGYLLSTLLDTAKALAILKSLRQPIEDLGAEVFIRHCEVPFYGFTDIPHTTLSYLEYVHAGVLASYLISRRPTYLEQCETFVMNCQNRNGGFSRTIQGGIATLENTWHALHSLTLLSSLST